MSAITLADGTKADINRSNWADLARQQIALEDAKRGYADANENAATVQAFKQAGGLQNIYDYTNQGGPINVNDNPAVALNNQVQGIPLVGIANDLTWDNIKTEISKIPTVISSANTTVQLALVVGGIAAIAAIFYYGDRAVKAIKG